MRITSSTFSEGGAIPVRYTCDGDDLSPPLTWSGVPAGTETFALICDDPDAPVGTWVHWVYFNIPATVNQLPEGVSSDEEPSQGGRQGRNDFRRIGYGGPCPPGGTHRYYFKLYAVDDVLHLPAGATKKKLLKSMENHVLAEAQLMGTFRR